ncbi:MAG: hypothetical protein KDK39_16275 [Leptospiraceae bacterium]|nr:hypothetical protein [Leptospiraceae bacterium]
MLVLSNACLVSGRTAEYITETRQQWVEELPLNTHFKVPLFAVPNLDTSEQEQFTRFFGRELQKATARPCFVDLDSERETLKMAGKLIPSTNYHVHSKFLQIGQEVRIQVRILHNETGQVLAITSAKVAGKHSDLAVRIVKALVFQ